MKRIIQSYFDGWNCFLRNWRVALFIFFFNIVIAFIILGPLSSALQSAFGESLSLNTLASGFDYTIIMDFARENKIGISAFLNQSLFLIMLYILFYFFINGGIAKMSIIEPSRIRMADFLQACAEGFWRFSRLGVYVILLYGFCFWILFLYFSKDGLNPFNFDSEIILINRFWILLVLFAILTFLLSTFRDLAKLNILTHNTSWIYHSNLKAGKQVFVIRHLALSLLNVLVLIFLGFLYHMMKLTFSDYSWSAILIGQLFIFYRIGYRIIRLRSFYTIQSQ